MCFVVCCVAGMSMLQEITMEDITFRHGWWSNMVYEDKDYDFDKTVGVVYRGQVVGKVCYEFDKSVPDAHVLHMGKIFVLQAFRNNGIGSLLLQHCVKVSRDQNCIMLFYVDKETPDETQNKLVDFYTKRGFQKASEKQAKDWQWSFKPECEYLMYYQT